MADPTNPHAWLDAMEQVRPQFEPLSVDTLAPRIEALCAAQGLPAFPGQAQAAAQICLTDTVPPPPPPPAPSLFTRVLDWSLKGILICGFGLAIVMAVDQWGHGASLSAMEQAQGAWVDSRGASLQADEAEAMANLSEAQLSGTLSAWPDHTAEARAFMADQQARWNRGAAAEVDFSASGWADYQREQALPTIVPLGPGQQFTLQEANLAVARTYANGEAGQVGPGSVTVWTFYTHVSRTQGTVAQQLIQRTQVLRQATGKWVIQSVELGRLSSRDNG